MRSRCSATPTLMEWPRTSPDTYGNRSEACPAPFVNPWLARRVNNLLFATRVQAIPRSLTTLSPALTSLPWMYKCP